MLLHQRFVRTARTFASKTAIIDRTTGTRLSYGRALIASLILSEKFGQYEEGFIGIMLPTSAGCALSILGALMSGRTPVMINYSTGAAQNCEYAQKKCDFHTIITSKVLLEKVNCPRMPGMVFLEDLVPGDKIRMKQVAQQLDTFRHTRARPRVVRVCVYCVDMRVRR
jgi:acyl-[acyl-carrier-protein]-phospholipid O-acyltransferase/long-chain-fatty-acid--[acyl-carrier-protein] ligase